MIARVRLQHFRKHEDFETTFQPGTTIITGPNGSGKTSLIEAIHIAIQGKSWRSDFTEMIKNDQDSDWWRLDIDFSDVNGYKFSQDCNTQVLLYLQDQMASLDQQV